MINYTTISIAIVVGIVLLLKLYTWVLEIRLRRFNNNFYSWSSKDLNDWLDTHPKRGMKFYAVCEEIKTRKRLGIDDDSYVRAKNEQPID